MAAHSSILAWRTPMDRRPWRATVRGVAKSWKFLEIEFPILCSIRNTHVGTRLTVKLWAVQQIPDNQQVRKLSEAEGG